MSGELNLGSLRAKKARLANRIHGSVWMVLISSMGLFGAGGLGLLIQDGTRHIGYAVLALALANLMTALWYKRDLSHFPARIPARSLDDILEPGLLGSFGKNNHVSPKRAWEIAQKTWAARFLTNHLLIDPQQIGQLLSETEAEMPPIWQACQDLMVKTGSPELDGAVLSACLIAGSEPTKQYLASRNLKQEDVVETYGWFIRLNQFINQPKPYFGGIGRDWASGFTPTLDRFGQNVSRMIEAGGGHFHTLAHGDVLNSVVHNLSQGSGSVALVGEVGTGKTGLAYGLAQRLLEGRDESLRYYQMLSLNASLILSSAGNELEKIMLTLFGEAMHAGNVIIFLDEARLFFGSGTGAIDISQILLPVLQNHNVKVIAAFTPGDFQQLKASNESLATTLAVINVTEPDRPLTMKILEDTALTFEAKDKLLVSYEALSEAYRLSGQYMQDQAYPGKAINVLEQAIPYTENNVMTAVSVQTAIEKTHGVKVSKAQAPEADALLHLEASIHARMINQDRAVKVIAAALRRGRAGVASPNRPVGSFLFLGPTGVGKTELARSLAATYFGNERQMIRLDMTEYQSAEDVGRLLDGGGANDKSLMLAIREQPFSVVLLDEIEKAHPNVLNLLLQMLDEGQLTDQTGKPASFKNAIIITTSNAGSAEITERIAAGDGLETFERPLINKLISQGQFKPELINRFDEIVLFRPLSQAELAQVAGLMLAEVNKTLSNQNVKVELTQAALDAVVKAGYDPQFGARPMRRVIQKMVEDTIATRLLSNQAQAGSTIVLDDKDLS
ncbi:Clp protease [Candidatus Saccharibacteria bacterium CG10_big_fil_rev_8_21_14_0_10_47_8]|nr:MAG: Clp protease [Candidatus Saccharibacteria bacterium CG10_big_fil_rev_8_21_14_0_10_47_8]